MKGRFTTNIAIVLMLITPHFIVEPKKLVAATTSPTQSYKSSSGVLRAISIKVLQQRLIASGDIGECSSELLQLVPFLKS